MTRTVYLVVLLVLTFLALSGALLMMYLLWRDRER